LLKLNIGYERFYLCRLFTIDWFTPEIVTVQYNSQLYTDACLIEKDRLGGGSVMEYLQGCNVLLNREMLQ
jgi:hypothetical protein